MICILYSILTVVNELTGSLEFRVGGTSADPAGVA
jgi:hypothetical protein